jgi:hypothetical protein
MNAETAIALGRLAGVDVPPEDVQPLLEAVRGHRRAFADALAHLDLHADEPAVPFDPRWP